MAGINFLVFLFSTNLSNFVVFYFQKEVVKLKTMNVVHYLTMRLQRFSETTTETTTTTTETESEGGGADVVVVENTGASEQASVDVLIFTQEQINAIDEKVNALRSEMESLWQAQWNDWKAQAIADLEARVAAIEGGGVDESTEEETATETVIEGSEETDGTETDTGNVETETTETTTETTRHPRAWF